MTGAADKRHQAGGNVGSYFVHELLKSGKHTVTALTRPDSSNKLPPGIRRAVVNYDDQASIVDALRGQQFLIITMNPMAPRDTQSKLVRAAAQAGVAYVMPSSYSPDPLNESMMRQYLAGMPFLSARREIEALGVSSWVAFGCGFWFEWSLVGGRDNYGCDLAGREMTFYDDGAERITSSTWPQCGRAMAAFLGLKVLPEDEDDRAPAVDNWANRALYISSFLANQKEMFESVKRVTGTTDADWMLKYVNSEERFKEGHEALKKGDMSGFTRQLYARVFYPTGEGDHSRLGLANEALGLPQEDMDEATRQGLVLRNQGKLSYF